MSAIILSQTVEQAMIYQEYRRLIDSLLLQDKTTGSNHSPAMLHYTTMNIVRMERLDKTVRLTEEVRQQMKKIRRPMIWLTLTEAWCGDAAQIIPVMEKLCRESEKVELRLILRDEYPSIMDAFLTDGARSIPKVIFLDADTRSVLGSWGPRPTAAQEMVMEAKREMAVMENKEARKERFNRLSVDLQKWYAKDKTRSTQKELMAAVLEAASLKAI